MEDDRPYRISGVWTAPLTIDFLCSSCRYRIMHWRGGGTCGTDPLKLTVARACRDYEPWASADDQAVHVAFRLACDDFSARLKRANERRDRDQ